MNRCSNSGESSQGRERNRREVGEEKESEERSTIACTGAIASASVISTVFFTISFVIRFQSACVMPASRVCVPASRPAAVEGTIMGLPAGGECSIISGAPSWIRRQSDKERTALGLSISSVVRLWGASQRTVPPPRCHTSLNAECNKQCRNTAACGPWLKRSQDTNYKGKNMLNPRVS